MIPNKLSLLLLFVLIIIIDQLSYGQSYNHRNIAANEAIGNTTTTNTNYGAGLSNIAGIAKIDKFVLASSYRHVAELEGFNTAVLTVTLPIQIGSFAFSATRFGDDLFNQQTISIGYANNFGIASLGVRTNYLQYTTEGYGSKGVITVDIGGIAQLTDQLLIGAHIGNVNQAKLAEFQDERVPTNIAVGISYRPTQKVMVNIEVEKDIDFDPVFKGGIEYKVIDKLALRTGINTKPNRQYYGLGFSPNNIPLTLDYTLSNNQFVGISHQIGLAYGLKNMR